jgi:hypothetical protein
MSARSAAPADFSSPPDPPAACGSGALKSAINFFPAHLFLEKKIVTL